MVTASFPRRVWAKVCKDGPIMPNMTTPCWVWTGAKDGKGYGHLSKGSAGEGLIQAHRATFWLTFGRLPSLLDHTCNNRCCVRPDHLVESDHATNIRRGQSPGAKSWRFRQQTGTCYNGHEVTKFWNFHRRRCRRCEAEKQRQRREAAHTATCATGEAATLDEIGETW